MRSAETAAMSQQAAAGQGALMGRGGGQGTRNFRFHPLAGHGMKGFKSGISEIMMDTFNTGQNKFYRTVYTVAKEHCEVVPTAHVSA